MRRAALGLESRLQLLSALQLIVAPAAGCDAAPAETQSRLDEDQRVAPAREGRTEQEGTSSTSTPFVLVCSKSFTFFSISLSTRGWTQLSSSTSFSREAKTTLATALRSTFPSAPM
jgi:curli biogenesis system outer membrane secretion channel CsgG